MVGSLESARTGLQAFQRSVAVAAHNIANIRTDGFQPSRVSFSEAATGGVTTHVLPDLPQNRSMPSTVNHPVLTEQPTIDPAGSILDLLVGRRGFELNLQTIRTADSILGAIVNLKR